MSTSHQLALISSLAAVVSVAAAAEPIEAQTLSARPASVSLTVVIPPRSSDVTGVPIAQGARIVARSSTAFDVEKVVGLIDRPVSRIDVRRGTGWSPHAPRVWVQNRHGEFELLDARAAVVAIDAPGAGAGVQAAVRFRVESDRPDAPLDMPVEYRITIGEGDQIAVWRFTSAIRPPRDDDTESRPR